MEVGRDQGGRTPRDKERSTRTHRPHLDRNSMPTHIASSATYTRCEAKVSAIVHGLQVERPDRSRVCSTQLQLQLQCVDLIG